MTPDVLCIELAVTSALAEKIPTVRTVATRVANKGEVMKEVLRGFLLETGNEPGVKGEVCDFCFWSGRVAMVVVLVEVFG